MRQVAVLLYPGCIFFEIALAAETLADRFAVRFLTPDGEALRLSNGAVIASDGPFASLAGREPAAVLVPGGDPASLLQPRRPELDQLAVLSARGVVLAGICAGNLVLAAAGVLAGRRGTHNYTAEHAPPEHVAATRPFWAGLRFERADLVRDGHLITAQPWAYRAYAACVAEALGVLTPAQGRALCELPQRQSIAASGRDGDDPTLPDAGGPAA